MGHLKDKAMVKIFDEYTKEKMNKPMGKLLRHTLTDKQKVKIVKKKFKDMIS